MKGGWVYIYPPDHKTGTIRQNKLHREDYRMVARRSYFIEWVYEDADSIMNDIDVIHAYSMDEAMDKFDQIADIPSDAKVVSVEVGREW
jgi:hypothetical protein